MIKLPKGYREYTPFTDLEDIKQLMMTQSRLSDDYVNTFTLVSFRREEDLDEVNNGKDFYEVYLITIKIDKDDINNLNYSLINQIVENEKLVKRYKTLNGLIKGATNHVRNNKDNHRVYTLLEL